MAEVIKVSSANSPCAIETLRKLYGSYGIPDALVSNNRPGFASFETEWFSMRNIIYHAFTAPGHLSSNEQAERVVQTTRDSILRSVSENWNTDEPR